MSQNLCSGCDLCCKKYKIYLFPQEAKVMAKKLKVSNEKFITKYLDYYCEFFEFKNIKNNFTTVSLKNKNYSLFVTLSLKQKNNACIFLKNKECTIYSARPLICRLFPNFKFYGEEFSFCKLDKSAENAKKKDPRIFYPVLQKYLQQTKQKGLKKVWKYLPEIKEENVFVCENGKRKKYSKDVKELLTSVL